MPDQPLTALERALVTILISALLKEQRANPPKAKDKPKPKAKAKRKDRSKT